MFMCRNAEGVDGQRKGWEPLL